MTVEELAIIDIFETVKLRDFVKIDSDEETKHIMYYIPIKLTYMGQRIPNIPQLANIHNDFRVEEKIKNGEEVTIQHIAEPMFCEVMAAINKNQFNDIRFLDGEAYAIMKTAISATIVKQEGVDPSLWTSTIENYYFLKRSIDPSSVIGGQPHTKGQIKLINWDKA